MNNRPTIVFVLYSGKDFSFRDVELIAKHVNIKWKSDVRPRLICLWDKASIHYDLGYMEVLPLKTSPGVIGTWSRIHLYSPEMEQYKPFLYIDLDTAVITSLENIFDLVKDDSKFITLEDFWQKGQIATGLVWFPKNCKETQNIYNNFTAPIGVRMDSLIRKLCNSTIFWQRLTNTIIDFKPRDRQLLTVLPPNAGIVCFHGKPRIFEATHIKWVQEYINQAESKPERTFYSVTVIIPYKVDRGWLKDAIASVPRSVQLLVSQGEGNWPANFNKVFDQVKGKYVRWLHEDDMLTENSIQDSVRAIEEQNVDFIHGEAVEIFMNAGRATARYTPKIQIPTLQDLLTKNIIHSATLLYKKEVFEKVGLLDETLNTAEEFEFNLRCLKAGMKIGYCSAPLAFYRRHPQQKVRTVNIYEKKAEREMVRNKYKIA